MKESFSVVLFTAIASLAVLPTAYALVLSVLKPLLASRQARESALIIRHASIMDAGRPSEQGDREALDALNESSRKYKADLALLQSRDRHMTSRRALVLPLLYWLGAIGCSGIGPIRVAAAAPTQDGYGFDVWVLMALSVGLLLAGYWQVVATLWSTRRAIEDSLPSLSISVSQPYESPESLAQTQPWTLQVDIAVANTATSVAKNAQVEVICHDHTSNLYFPVLKPKMITRDGVQVLAGYTPAFNIKGMDSYLQYLLIRPNRPGTYRLTFVPRSDDLIGDPTTITFNVASIPDRAIAGRPSRSS